MKKRKHRRKAWKIVLAVLAVVILFAAIVVFGFRTRSIEVEGNEYYGESSILAWIENDKLSVNTLYLFLKYDYLGADVPNGSGEHDGLTEESLDGPRDSPGEGNAWICRL